MIVLCRLRSLWRNLTRRGRVERDLDEEMMAVFQALEDEHVRSGMSPAEARRAAAVALGGATQIKERVRDVRAGAAVEQVGRDVRYAIRMMRRDAGFTAIAATTLALGIGANTAVFSVVDTVVFRPLPYTDPDALVKICGTGPRDPACDDDFSFAELDGIRRQGDAFEQIAADDGTRANVVRADGSRESLGIGMVTSNWLSTLGVRPLLGRDFTADEEQPGRECVVILTHDYWRRRFNADAHVVGDTLVLDGVTHTVIGVLPPNVIRFYADVLKPLVAAGYSDRSLDVFGRLRPGVTLAQARAGLDIIGRRLEEEYPATNKDRRLGAEPLGKYYVSIQQKAEQGLVLMLGAVGLVLLIACTNVANLLLARAAVRRRESFIRSALGASRGRLVRQFLIESVLLFLVGGTLGLIVARVSLDSLSSLAVSGGYVPERMAVSEDARVLGMSVLVSLLAGLAFGLVPALQASSVDLSAALRDSTQTLTGGSRRGRTRAVLIVSEIALSLALLAGFGLLIRSFDRVYAASGGFNPENVVVTGAEGGRSFPEAVAFWRAALAHARAIAGVTSAAVTSRPPLQNPRRQRFTIDGGRRMPADDAPQADDILVSADYFRTLGIPILKGRALTDADNERSGSVAVISESLARRYFQGQDPVGRRISLLEHAPMSCCSAPHPVDGVWREIVGVAGDVRQANMDEEPAVTVYRPYTQIVEHDMYLVLHADSGPRAGSIAAGLRSQLAGPDHQSDWSNARTMAQMIHDSESIRLRRFVLILLGCFATIAVLLAGVGIFGVASSAVAERTREIGVRIALGATRPVILRQLVGEMMALAAAGVALGAAGMLVVTRLIRSMLFGVGAADMTTYVAVAVLLGAVVLFAACLPARRAMRIDPIVALRSE